MAIGDDGKPTGPAVTGLSPAHAYTTMCRIRRFEELCRRLRREDLIAGSIHLCAGQEAIPTAAGVLLRPDDSVVATYRGHGWAIARGVPLEQLLAEICHRATGTNGGRGGSAYLTAFEHGLIGENSIVGAGVPIAAGVALAHALASTERIALVTIGDGATSQGAVHEAMVLASAKALPLVMVCENNGWSEMTPIGDIVPVARLSDRAPGYGIAGHFVDGGDPWLVHDMLAQAIDRARRGEGPSFIECSTVRLWGHYNADIQHYRPRSDRDAAEAADPLARLRIKLLDSGDLTEPELDGIEAGISEELAIAETFARTSPHPDPASARDHVVRHHAVRDAAHGSSAAETCEMSYVAAVNAALRDELMTRDELVVFGEDVGTPGGVFGATRDLQKEFGVQRVFDTPIAESAILGCGIGLALQGYRPVAEIMWADFLLVALDQLVNQAANVRYLSRGARSLPLVVRTQQGVTPGSCAQHSQSLEALLAHVPGLKVGLPATPQDAYSMLRAAIADEDPCIVIEARALYQSKGPVTRVADQTVGGARIYGSGEDISIVSWGPMVHVARAAAKRLEADDIDATVVDMRWLSPLDDDALTRAIGSSGRVLVVHEANLTGGFGGEILARIAERHLGDVDGLGRIGAPDVRFPAAPGLQAALLPDDSAVVAAARALLGLPSGSPSPRKVSR